MLKLKSRHESHRDATVDGAGQHDPYMSAMLSNAGDMITSISPLKAITESSLKLHSHRLTVLTTFLFFVLELGNFCVNVSQPVI